MPIDPATVAAGLAAAKTGFDTLRSAIGLVKEAKSLVPSDPERDRAVNLALDEADKAAKIAEAQIAQALGFELCQCEFPPSVMLTVGTHTASVAKLGKPVFECPKCKRNTSYPIKFERMPGR